MESGAIIHIDYNLYNADTDYLIETTKEEVAKEAERHDPSKTYTPLVTVIGDGRLIAGFEEHLAEADVETDYVLVIPAEKAYGEKDPDSIEIMSQPQLLRNVRDADSLAIGGPVEIGGRNGVLTSLRAGRARVDFNHPLAGASLRYEYRIVKVIEDRAEKVQTLLETNTGRDGFEVEFEGDDVTITLPEFVSYDQNWAFTKFSLIRTLRDHVGVETIVLKEVHEPRSPEAEDEAEDGHEHEGEDGHVHDENCDHGEEE
jgi:FKBP-type peptidyl-prolyl cis-trans isomerase 2